MAANVLASGNPFSGGAQQRNLAPPTVGGAFNSANTRVGAPQQGVNPSQIKSARPNEGSNIGIPYTRLVPGTGAYKYDGGTSPTDDLKATTLAFILGVNAKQKNGIEGGRNDMEKNLNRYPGMPGTERFQQLCSIEYLQKNFQSNKTSIKLNEQFDVSVDSDSSASDRGDRETQFRAGHVGEYMNHYDKKTDPNLSWSMLNVPDLARQISHTNSECKKTGEKYQGVFVRDLGPFLRGKGSNAEIVNVGDLSKKHIDTDSRHKVKQQYMSRNFGDDVAFEMLEEKLAASGLMDWTPDGIVLSKGDNDLSDENSDRYFDQRDGQLFNIRVQGPAIGTTWTGDSSMETLPLDKVFVVIVADVWFDVDADDAKMQVVLNRTEGDQEKYDKLCEEKRKGPFDMKQFEKKQQAAYRDNDTAKDATAKVENTVLTNFRLMASTSSQMINYSQYKEKNHQGGYSQTGKKQRLAGKSRMGLELHNDFGAYIVGGWQIGNVLDTSASRAVSSTATLIGVRTAPNSSALNVNVNVAWFTANRMCQSFNNREGTFRARFNASRKDKKELKNPVNMATSSIQKFDAKCAKIEVEAEEAAARMRRDAAAALLQSAPPMSARRDAAAAVLQNAAPKSARLNAAAAVLQSAPPKSASVP